MKLGLEERGEREESTETDRHIKETGEWGVVGVSGQQRCNRCQIGSTLHSLAACPSRSHVAESHSTLPIWSNCADTRYENLSK